ncbi:MAG: DUF2806 domain-containing protein [Lachnospiraceae bacterium]|nr:DUF2806 domain-containing protein [Lachnospiraceae bacterium]
MDLTSGTAVAKTAVDLVKNENVLNKSVGVMGMLFPYAGLKQKAVEMYVEDIEKSDLPAETKVFMVLNTKKTFKKIKNQKAIAEIAMENAKQGTDFSDDSGVSEEWLDRFMDSAGFVSSEEIQWIWGKILANEFEKPGSTPPNMIRILSEFTPGLAAAFRYICSMCIWILPLGDNGEIQGGFQKLVVPYNNNDEKFRECGVSFNVLNELETLGVIRFESLAGYISKGFLNDKILICVGDELDVIEEYQKGELPIGNVMLTSVGEALKTITDSVEISGYYEMVKKYMLDKGVKFSDEHDYYAETKGDELTIHRKNP